MDSARSDAMLLGDIPDFIALPLLMKATPAEEGLERVLYLEASNEKRDSSNEVVLLKALQDSSDYYLRHGNVDISHYTVLGPRSGVANFLEYEIGLPTEVRVDGQTTFVKAQLYRGDSPMAKNADMVWSSLTRQKPPQRWYPSVGGKVLAKAVQMDPDTGAKYGVVSKVLWTNTALDRNPINLGLREATLMPPSVFVKSLGGFVLTKALEAGYGTDSAGLSGGGALRRQSLHGAGDGKKDYAVLATTLGEAMLVGQLGLDPHQEDLAAWLRKHHGLSEDEATETVGHFMRDLAQQRRH